MVRGHLGSRRFKPACSSFVKMPAGGLPPHGASPELRSVAFALGRLWRQKRRGLPLAVRESFLDLLLVVQADVLPTHGSCPVTVSEARDDVKGLIDLCKDVAMRPAAVLTVPSPTLPPPPPPPIELVSAVECVELEKFRHGLYHGTHHSWQAVPTDMMDPVTCVQPVGLISDGPGTGKGQPWLHHSVDWESLTLQVQHVFHHSNVEAAVEEKCYTLDGMPAVLAWEADAGTSGTESSSCDGDFVSFSSCCYFLSIMDQED